MKQIIGDLQGEHVSVGQIAARFRRRSFGGIVFVLTLLGLLPVISFFAGLLLLLPAVQMAAGFQTPVLPRFAAERRIAASKLVDLGQKALPWIERTERYIKPRWLILTRPPMPMLLGSVIAVLGLALTLPVPLVNLPPSVALLFLSAGIIERDGVMIAIGLVVSMFALMLSGLMMFLAIEGVMLIFRSHFG